MLAERVIAGEIAVPNGGCGRTISRQKFQRSQVPVREGSRRLEAQGLVTERSRGAACRAPG